MTAFCKVERHLFSSFVPNSNTSLSISFLIQVPRTTNDREEICDHNSQLRDFPAFFSLYNVVEHWHEADPAFELLWITLSFFHKFLNLFEEAKCCGSWEYFPLELHRFSINTIQIFQMIALEIPHNLLLIPIKRNSVSSGYMSHCGTSAFYYHPKSRLHCPQKNIEHHTKWKDFAFDETELINSRLLCLVGSSVWFWVCLFDVVSREEFPGAWSLVFFDCVGEEWKTSIAKSQRSRAGIPSMRKPASRDIAQLPLSCVRPRSASCTSNLLVQMFDIPKYTKVHLMLILSLQSLPQNQNLETILICFVVLCSPHSNIAWIHLCDEWKRQKRQSFVTSFRPFCDRTSKFFTDHQISGLPLRAKYGHFRAIREQTVDNSPTDPFSSFYNCSAVLFANSQRLSTMSWDHAVSLQLYLLVIFPQHQQKS